MLLKLPKFQLNKYNIIYKKLNNIMKIIKTIISALSLVFLVTIWGCTTTTTDNSIQMAKSGNTVLTYNAIDKSADDVKHAMLLALQGRHWTITNTNFPITAQISNRGQLAKVSITFANGSILIDTKGSNIDGEKYVPLRYVDFLMKTAYKYLKK